MSKNKDTKPIEDLKMEMIAYDYKIGTSWENKFFKKRCCFKNFERVMFFHYLDLIQEIRDAAQRNEEV